MENPALLAVEYAEQHEVAIEEIEERADVKRQPEIYLLEEEDALVGCAKKARRGLPLDNFAPPLKLSSVNISETISIFRADCRMRIGKTDSTPLRLRFFFSCASSVKQPFSPEAQS